MVLWQIYNACENRLYDTFIPASIIALTIVEISANINNLQTRFRLSGLQRDIIKQGTYVYLITGSINYEYFTNWYALTTIYWIASFQNNYVYVPSNWIEIVIWLIILPVDEKDQIKEVVKVGAASAVFGEN